MVDPKIQTEAIPDLERIAAEYVEPGTLLREIQPVLKTQPLRKLAGIQPEEFACLIVAE